MQTYGARHNDVAAFLASLPALTYESWHDARMTIVRSVVDLYEKYDSARLHLTVTEQNHPAIDQAASAARRAAKTAASSLDWVVDHPEAVRDAEDAARAIVALDAIDFDTLVILFFPFRHTRVVVPVTWG